MNDLSLVKYTFQGVQVRTQRDEAGEPLFCLSDVCKVLGMNGTENTVRQIKEEFSEGAVFNTAPLKTIRVETAGGIQSLVFITEPQLYFVMMRSRSEFARPFRQWVTSEVLPSIRKTGKYESGQKPDLEQKLKLAKLILEPAGIECNQLTLALDKVYNANTGESLLEQAGVQLIAPTQERLVNPTELGKSFGLTAVKVNLRLAEMGYQIRKGKEWELTEKGKATGGVYLDTGKKHSNGTPIRQIKWPSTLERSLREPSA